MNLEADLIIKISKRVSKLYENKSVILNAEIKGIQMISDNVVNALKQGKNYNHSTYLSKGQTERLEEIFGVSRGELYFGDKKEIEKLVKDLFYKIAYNFKIDKSIKWNKYVHYDEDLEYISNSFIEITFFSARIAFLWSLVEMQNPLDKNIPVFELDESHRKQYDQIVDFIWEKNSWDITNSFLDNVVNYKKLLVKDINVLVLSWLKNEFTKILEVFKSKELSANSVLNIGFQIRDILLISKEVISMKIKEIEESNDVPDYLYEDLYNKWYPLKFETLENYNLMIKQDFDTPSLINNDKDLHQFEILLNIEKIYIDHAIALMKLQDELITLEGFELLELMIIPRVIRGR